MVTLETPPALRSMSISSTPSSDSSSSLTADTQCPQVIPETWTVVEMVLICWLLVMGRRVGRLDGWLVLPLPQQAPNGVRGFLHFEVDRLGPQAGIGLRGGADDAVADVFLDEAEA